MSEKRQDSPGQKAGDKEHVEVQEALGRYRAFVEIVPDAVILTDITGIFLMVNDAAVELYGASNRDELLGKNSLDFLTPKSREEVTAAGEFTIKHGVGQKGIYEVVQPDGSLLTAEANSSLLRSLDGRKIGFIAVIRDITERMEHSEDLRTSEEKYRHLVEDSLQGVAIIQDEKYAYTNSAFAETLGYRADELLEFSPDDVWNLIYPEDAAELVNRNAELEAGRTPLPRHKFRYLAKDGSIKWVESFVTKTELNGRTALQVLEIDITEKMTAELALRESEEKYRTLVSSMQDLVFVYNENDEYAQYYASDESLLYVSPDLFLGKHVNQVLPEKVAQLHQDAAARVRALEQSETFDYPLKLDGHVYWFSARFTLHEDKVSVVSVVRDITPRKEAELALLESEERFSLFADNFPGPVFIKDEDSVILYANSFMIERFDAADWLGRNTSDLFPPEVARAMIKSDQRALREGGLEEVQVVPDKEGTVHVYQTFKFPIERESKPLLMGGISLDITSRVFTEDALKQSEERYRTLFELAPVSISITDFEGNFTAVNRGFLDSVGYTWEELRFTNASALYANPTGRQALIKNLRREKKIRNVELDLRRKDGTVFTVLLNEDTIELGGRTLILAMIRDVTDLKEAEDALRESEEELRRSSQLLETIYNAIPDVVISTDQSFNIVTCNRSVERVLDYTPEELVGQNYSMLLPEDVRDSPEQQRRQAELYAQGYLIQEDFQFKRKSGEVFPASFSVALIRDEMGVLSGMVGALRDITDRVADEREILAARDRAMLYLDLMTHDISNQMQVIVAGTQLARDSDNPEEVTRVLHLVEEASSRCNNIISRVVTTRQLATAPLRSISLDMLLTVLVEDFAALHEDITVDTDIPGIVAKVQADEYLDTMLLTLLENAIQHNPRDDEKKRVWVKLRDINGGYLICISDNGEGLSDTQKEWLLDMRRRFGGIGLHLAKQIVEKHAGRIEVADRVDGDPSKGAEFRVWIPKSV